jgi:multicomponent K+:H+ antiporter subunit C
MLALSIGVLAACGLFLIVRARGFAVVLGLVLLSYAVNLLIVASGRVNASAPPIISDRATAYADPLPQALVLTAIVIGFAMTAYLVALTLRANAEENDPPSGDERS